ncbi:MAG: hypothetical protein C0594_11085 [Marinilabiliales bacterium]|nr:MAG: hypothetical protein C0594_11085 [Marinilabiliales bacterium]
MNEKSGAKPCLYCGAKATCFTKLTDEELIVTGESRVEIKYKKGEIITKQGSFASNILFLKEGLVKLYLETEGDHDFILNFYNAGKLIGLPSLYDTIVSYSVAAVEDCVVCSIDIGTFRNLVMENGKFAAEIINTINHCTQFSFDKMVSLTQKQLNGRLADAFIYFSKYVFDSQKFKLNISRKEMADFTGMSTISVIRILKDFNKDGLVVYNNGYYEIPDMKRLEQISAVG